MRDVCDERFIALFQKEARRSDAGGNSKPRFVALDNSLFEAHRAISLVDQDVEVRDGKTAGPLTRILEPRFPGDAPDDNSN